MIWLSATTGSHIGGRWMEADESASADAGSLNVKRADAEAFYRDQMQNAQGPQNMPGQGSRPP